jgi:hypothetical protein
MMSDHERIFLEPLENADLSDYGDGRQWCEDNGCWDKPGVEYVRADLYQAAIAAARADEREQCAQIADDIYDDAPSGSYDNGGTQDGWQMASIECAKLIRARASKEPT